MLAFASCASYEPLPQTDAMLQAISGLAVIDGDGIIIATGKYSPVRVIHGAKVQAFSENPFVVPDGVCGYVFYDHVTISDAYGCGSLEATLLHEIGHLYGLPHGNGIMASDYAGPITPEDKTALIVDAMMAAYQ